MAGQNYQPGSPSHTSETELEMYTARYVTVSGGAGRLLPSTSKWNSIDFGYSQALQSSTEYEPRCRYSKSIDFELVISNRKYFRSFIYTSTSIVLLMVLLILLLQFLSHKHHHHVPSKNLTLALNQALMFFDAQKCMCQVSISVRIPYNCFVIIINVVFSYSR